MSMEAARYGDLPVVLVDDDELFLAIMAEQLRDAGHRVQALLGPKAALDFFSGGGKASALVLDWQMPGMNGPDLLLQLRDAGVDAPALFLTGLNQPVIEERGFKLGAVDFIDKTKSFGIIHSRLKLAASGQKMTDSGATPASSRVGALELDRESCRATWRDAPVSLTLAEFKLVACLADGGGAPVTFRALYDAVRGTDFKAGAGEDGYRENVRVALRRTKKKFQASDPAFDALHSVAGVGYRWSEPAAG